jgi:hypothetical protein
MNADAKRVIVTESCCPACSVHMVLVHHESFPEMCVEGMTAEMAAGHLANRLAAAQDSVPDLAHREAVRRALADTQAFLDRKGAAHPWRDVSGPHRS